MEENNPVSSIINIFAGVLGIFGGLYLTIFSVIFGVGYGIILGLMLCGGGWLLLSKVYKKINKIQNGTKVIPIIFLFIFLIIAGFLIYIVYLNI